EAMRGWMVGLWIAGLLGTVPASGREAPSARAPSDVEVDTLRAKLAEREAALQALQDKLEAVSDEKLFTQAQALGVTEAVSKSWLTERQQRRLAVAIVRESERNGLDPLLVVAIIRCESSFNNYAVSGVGAMGLMQVMPDTGKALAEKAGRRLRRSTNLFDEE